MSARLLFHGAGANAGKTVFTRAACRWRSNEGARVAPFKAVSVSRKIEARGGNALDFRMWLLAAAARCAVSASNGPVHVAAYTGRVRGRLLLGGDQAGEVDLLADDSPVLSPPDPRFGQARELVLASLGKLAADHDEIIVEGAGCAVDLGEHDLANLLVARSTRAPIVVVASAGAGGALPAIAGLLAAYPPDIREQVAGFALNDVRPGAGRLFQAAARLESDAGIRFLGGFPHAEIYDVIPPGEHSSLGDDEAEYEWLAKRMNDNVDLSAAANWEAQS
jgi:adenosylcobyric acid synthase